MIVRRVSIESLSDGAALARRVGIAPGQERQAAGAMARPLHLLVTGIRQEDGAALQALGRHPEEEQSRPAIFYGGGEAALICGTRWECFSLASRAALGEAPALEDLASALGSTLSRSEGAFATWGVGDHAYGADARCDLMAILNVTPDSFSDGGQFLQPEEAIDQGKRLIKAGADLLDIGGESTRPGAAVVSADEELARVLPVIKGLCNLGVPLSIDTRKARVAEAALAAGAEIVNDVSGLEDPRMAETVAEAGASLCLMHSRGDSASMQTRCDYEDLWEQILETLELAREQALRAGVNASKIALDPGLGFAKTADQNLWLLGGLQEARGLGSALLIGASRKSFIGACTGAPVGDRLPGSLAAAVVAVQAGVRLLRVHEVSAHRQAVDLACAVSAAQPMGRRFEAVTPAAPGAA